MSRCYLTTTLTSSDDTGRATVALELVQADVLARHYRMRGDRVRFLAGGPTAAALREPLALSYNDFLDPTDPRHTTGVTRLLDACAASGDLDGSTFRLSRHAPRIRAEIATGALRVEPAAHRAPLLADDLTENLTEALADFPIEALDRSTLSPITSLGYADDGPHLHRWWLGGDRRIHVIGANAVRDTALRWPALLHSAGLPLPTDILVHDDLTTDEDLGALAERWGADAVRWWLVREPPGTTLTVRRLVARANDDLASDLGALVDRVTTMIHRYRNSRPPMVEATPETQSLLDLCRTTPDQVHAALVTADFGAASAAVWRIVEAASQHFQESRPWDLARAERDGDRTAGARLDASLSALITACRTLANELTPFLPTLATRIAEQSFALSGTLAPPQPLFPRLHSPGRPSNVR